MMENAVMEFTKWFIGMLCLAFVIMMCVFMFKLNEVNSFQQEVNYQIERHGGLTEEALVALNDHAKDSYGGCIVKSAKMNAPCVFNDSSTSSGFFVEQYTGKEYIVRPHDEQAPYGTEINYVITRQIGDGPLMKMVQPSILGSSSSRVRGTAVN